MLAFGLALAPLAAAAQSSPDPAAPPAVPEAILKEAREAWQAAAAAAQRGPADIALLDEARLHLPVGTAFIPAAQAARLLRSWGNRVTADPAGLVVGTGADDQWSVIIRFVGEGYIKDDDAKNWNAGEMLESLREGNDTANVERRNRGFPETEIVGWIAPPSYDPATHFLVSSIAQRDKGESDSAVRGINYLTYALGRNGYFSLDLLSSSDRFESDRAAATPVLNGLDYNAGHRYADFNASSDHIAAYGLAALVGVVAVKKLGLLALAGVFLLKFAKLGAIAVAVIGGTVARLFRRKAKPTGDVG
jgi:uncharacterized membrane-anchored protein